ncbi:MAG: sulfatase/phosphatase domain-containing protein, partial [Burkholderiales bacterium]
GMLYEGGVRVPLICRWPGVIKPGAVCDEPVMSVDFYPTFLELAGAKLDPQYLLDGVSFVPLLKSGGRSKLNREALYWHFPGYLESLDTNGRNHWRATPSGAIRVGDDKLIEYFEDGRVELFDLKHDLGEQTNLAAGRPDKARALRARLAAWRQAVNAPMPQPNPKYDPSNSR